MIKKLESVGCSIDTKTNMVYPNLRTGKIDKKNGTPLNECEDSWFDNLSDVDFSTISLILDNITKNLLK